MVGSADGYFEMNERIVKCPYCEREAELVGGDVIYPHRHDLAHKKFWLCRSCGAWVGCHAGGDGTRPLGRLADAELRAAKQQAHAAFDPLWIRYADPRNQSAKRKQAYAWLAGHLGINKKQCHIGKFDVTFCRLVVEICRERGSEFR